MKIKIYGLFLLLLSLLSCKDDESLNKLVLDKIVYHENIDQVGQFKYYSNGTIEQYQYYFDSKKIDYTNYLYKNGKLISKEFYTQSSNPVGSPYTLINTALFTYYQTGEIARAYSDGTSPETTDIYKYTWSNGNAVKVEILYGIGTTGIYEMQYDTNGNVIKRLHFIVDNDLPTLDFVIEYEYDNKINPLFDLHEPIDLLTNIPKNISPNNVVQSVQRLTEDGEAYSTTEIEYTYNEFNLPVEKIESTNLNGQETQSTVKFFYKRI
ncbi:MAG: hypothetical protein ABI663_00210 [Chryseolinea sp.]